MELENYNALNVVVIPSDLLSFYERYFLFEDKLICVISCTCIRCDAVQMVQFLKTAYIPWGSPFRTRKKYNEKHYQNI